MALTPAQNSSSTLRNRTIDVRPVPEAEGTPIEVEMVSQNRFARMGRVPLYAQNGTLLGHVSRAQVGNGTRCVPTVVAAEVLPESGTALTAPENQLMHREQDYEGEVQVEEIRNCCQNIGDQYNRCRVRYEG